MGRVGVGVRGGLRESGHRFFERAGRLFAPGARTLSHAQTMQGLREVIADAILAGRFGDPRLSRMSAEIEAAVEAIVARKG